MNQKVLSAKAAIDRAKRRFYALASHGELVVDTAVGAVKSTATIAVTAGRRIVAEQRSSLRDDQSTLRSRLSTAGKVTRDGASDAYVEVSRSLKEGYQKVSEKVVRIPTVTRKEQAEENKIERKLKKRVRRQSQQV